MTMESSRVIAMPPSTPRRRSAQAGFTLIELMVGVLIGMVTVLIVAQVFSFAEGQKRTTTTGADASVNGAIALFTLQRDVQGSGYGLAAKPEAIGCTVKAKSGAVNLEFPLAPVVITPGASSTVPDTIVVMSSGKTDFSIPMRVTENHPNTSEYFVVQSTLGVNKLTASAAGDTFVAVPAEWSAADWCTVFSAADTTGTVLSATMIPHNVNAVWNDNASVLPTAGYPAGSFLINMGTLSRRTYTVGAGGALQMDSIDPAGAAVSQELFPNVVNLKALYGKDTNGDGAIDLYDAVTPTTNAGWQQILAIRIALVTRSAQFEGQQNGVVQNNVTSAAPLWDVGSAVTVTGATDCHSGSKCLELGVSQVGADWGRYRYKVFETTVPLRNVLWNAAV